MQSLRLLAVAVLVLGSSSAALAQTQVTEAWVRDTVAQQKATGLFAQIKSTQGGRLVSASSPIAAVVEIHEMSMDGSMMKMRAIPGLDLPAGKTVELKPGSFHIMLMDLKKPVAAGETVPVTLVVEGADKKRETIEVQAAVKAMGMPQGGHDHGDHHHAH